MSWHSSTSLEVTLQKALPWVSRKGCWQQRVAVHPWSPLVPAPASSAPSLVLTFWVLPARVMMSGSGGLSPVVVTQGPVPSPWQGLVVDYYHLSAPSVDQPAPQSVLLEKRVTERS